MQKHHSPVGKGILALPLVLLAIAAPLARRAHREVEANRTEIAEQASIGGTKARDSRRIWGNADELAAAAERLREPEWLAFITRNDLFQGSKLVVTNAAGDSREGNIGQAFSGLDEFFTDPQAIPGGYLDSPGNLSAGTNTVWVGTRRGLVFGFTLPTAILLGNSEFRLIVSACPNAWGVPRLIAGSIDDLGRFVATNYIWPKDFTPPPAPADRPECK